MLDSTKVSVMGFKMSYKRLDKQAFENDREMYDLAITMLAMQEFDNHMVRIKRIGKATKNGTGVTFERCKDVDDATKYATELKEKFETQFQAMVNKQNNDTKCQLSE